MKNEFPKKAATIGYPKAESQKKQNIISILPIKLKEGTWDRLTKKSFLNDRDRNKVLTVRDSLFESTFRIIDTRTKIPKELRNNIFAIKKEIDELLTRNVLYIGSECERYDKIDITKEYKLFKGLLSDPYITLSTVDKSSIGNITQKWDSIKPSIIFISCHGDKMGLFLESEDGKSQHYPNKNFIDFFKKRSNYIECVILSSCESLDLGKAIFNEGKKVICINRQVDLDTAGQFNKYFFRYLNDHSKEDSTVFKDAFNHSVEIVKFEGFKDSFAFEFLEADKIC